MAPRASSREAEHVPCNDQNYYQAWPFLTYLKSGANLDAAGGGAYTVKAARRPQYAGANITPLRHSGGDIKVAVTNLGNGRSTGATPAG